MWPTPRGRSAFGNAINLADPARARTWPTPRAQCFHKQFKNTSARNALLLYTGIWPTPRAQPLIQTGTGCKNAPERGPRRARSDLVLGVGKALQQRDENLARTARATLFKEYKKRKLHPGDDLAWTRCHDAKFGHVFSSWTRRHTTVCDFDP